MAIKPKRLREGDTVAIVSQSSGAPYRFPHIYENGLRNLKESFGLEAKEYPTARADPGYLYDHPKERAEDINNAFQDPDVDAIFSSIGGEDSVRILPFLDYGEIRGTPKIFMGFSDANTVTSALNSRSDLVTFSGPSVMAGFSQMKEFPESFACHVEDMLFRSSGSYTFEPFPWYSEGYPEWSEVENTGRINRKKENKKGGWDWVQLGNEPKVRGVLFGGCMEVLEMMKGTEFWPSVEGGFWDGKILFLETSEVKPPPEYVRWWLRNYGSQGILGRISALLFARPAYYSDEEKSALRRSVLEVVGKEFGRPDMPIVLDMDFGHTDPRFIIPLGVEAEVGRERREFSLTESPTRT